MAFVVKNTTFYGILDLVAPFSCRGCGQLGAILCGRCKKHNTGHILEICPRCRKNHEMCFCDVPVYAVSYREGLLVDLVEDYKYKSIHQASSVLAELLDVAVPKVGSSVAVVPLPTISKHIRERGFDHMKLVAKQFVKLRRRAKSCYGKTFRQYQNVCENYSNQFAEEKSDYQLGIVLERDNNTTQVGSDRETRIKQAKEAYRLHKHVKIDPDKTYLLLDDIWTTGASMEAAIGVLKDAGAKKIIGAVLLAGR